MVTMMDSEILAYLNRVFLNSDAGRPLRVLAEYLHPLARFAQEKVHDTVVFFGSARIQPDGPEGQYYAAARQLAYLLSEWSMGLHCEKRRFVVCTGGGGGIMEAANRGAIDAGARSIGLNIGLPHEQRPNPYISPELNFEFHYFFMRKLWFAHLARAVVVFPGGFGTLDELCEVLTLSQTGKLARPIPVVLFGSEYWREIIDFGALQRRGMISSRDQGLFEFADSPESAFVALRTHLEPVSATLPPDSGFAGSITACSGRT